MNNLYKIVVGILFMVCLGYVIDNPTPNHVRTVPVLHLEELKELQLVNYELNKWEGVMMDMTVTNNNPATRKNE